MPTRSTTLSHFHDTMVLVEQPRIAQLHQGEYTCIAKQTCTPGGMLDVLRSRCSILQEWTCDFGFGFATRLLVTEFDSVRYS